MPTTTPRKSTPTRSRAKAAPAKQERPGVDLSSLPQDVQDMLRQPVEPVQITKRDREPAEMVTIFHLDGKDYQIPAKPGPAVVLRYMKEARKIGEAQAGFNVLNAMLGDEALEALSESQDVTDEDISKIYEIVTKVFFTGLTGMQEAQGN